MRTFRTIDAHTAGEPLRLIVDGWPEPEGATILERRDYAKRRQDRFRRALMLEPRGHADMYGALLTPPEREGSDTGVLFMHNEGFSTMCGHGVIAVVTILIERFEQYAGAREIVLDVPAGRIAARARVTVRKDGSRRVESVAFANVPSFVLAAGVPVTARGRTFRVDVAFGGAFYAICDAEGAGLGVAPERLHDLRELSVEIRAQVEKAVRVVHPLEGGLHGIYGTIFTGPPNSSAADLRNVTVFADREVDRSPCGSGTAAVMAVLDAMGMLPADHVFTHESIIDTTFRGRVLERTMVADLPAIVAEIEGSASITGDHVFVVSDDDPLAEGFRL
ncbi:MAG TPA: proline racemase family protein [Vicinamibacterales bacterium]|nr:proline racemase family protein [Vicinamibacterales bacterium]